MTSSRDRQQFDGHLRSFREHLMKAEHHLGALDLAEELEEVREAASREEFRISVLGRFKTGKSTFINALLGRAISPMDILPCTSQNIEFRGGKTLRYEQLVDGRLRQRSKADFENAVTVSVARAVDNDSGWRVRVPAEWMVPGVVLVDTPGTDEDPTRLAIADAELSRTDAALVVVRAAQAGTLSEIDQVRGLTGRVGLVLVVVNRCDEVPATQWPRLLSFAREQMLQLGVPPERVLLLSAKDAIQGQHDAVGQLSAVRDAVSDVLLGSVAGARLSSLCRRTEHLLGRLEPQIAHAVAAAQDRSERDRVGAAVARESFRESAATLELVASIFKDAGNRSARLSGQAMDWEWPNIPERLVRRQAHWTSEHSPVTSPKLFAKDIANQAQRHLELLVENSIAGHIQPIIENENSRALDDVHEQVEGLLRAASLTGSWTAEEIERRLINGAVRQAFGKTIDDASGNAAAGAAVGAVVSGIVAYIVAELILAYVLGMVVGLFNPIVLVAAIGAATAFYFLKGSDWLEEWARGRVVDQLAEELAKEKVRKKVVASVKSATKDATAKLASSYLGRLERVVDEAKKQHAKRRCEAKSSHRGAESAGSNAKEAQKALTKMCAGLAREAKAIDRMAR